MARLRGPQLSPGERVAAALDQSSAPALWSPVTVRRLGYADAVAEAMGVVEALGLDLLGPLDAADLIRFAYAQGWQAAEKRMGAPDMADQIDLAMRTPDAIVERRPGETPHGHEVRAIQQVVAYGVPNKGPADG